MFSVLTRRYRDSGKDKNPFRVKCAKPCTRLVAGLPTNGHSLGSNTHNSEGRARNNKILEKALCEPLESLQRVS